VQLPTVLLGTITTATQVGYYKVGTSAAAVVGRIADPGYAAVLPRLARLWAAGRKEDLVSLLRRTTIIAASLMTAMLGTIVLLRDPILRILGGARGTEAVTVLILVGAAQAINGAVFWNTSLLFAAGRSGLVTAVSLIGMAMQVGLLVPLALRFAADGAAGALLATYATTNLIITVLGIRTLSRLPTEHGSRTAENAVSSPPA
jgi:O-antigen/teichoic acid export membrane protein